MNTNPTFQKTLVCHQKEIKAKKCSPTSFLIQNLASSCFISFCPWWIVNWKPIILKSPQKLEEGRRKQKLSTKLCCCKPVLSRGGWTPTRERICGGRRFLVEKIWGSGRNTKEWIMNTADLNEEFIFNEKRVEMGRKVMIWNS